jgi:hypothetical protein
MTEKTQTSQSIENRFAAIDAPQPPNGIASPDHATDDELRAEIAAIMPSLEDIEKSIAGPSKEWRDDTSWIDAHAEG